MCGSILTNVGAEDIPELVRDKLGRRIYAPAWRTERSRAPEVEGWKKKG